jgi:ribose transport system ATP-binding protein
MEGITKRFPGVLALDGVNFDVRPGEVHVLLGENGAGKSTLIKALSGCFPLDSGNIFIAGQAVRTGVPQEPLRMGVRFIYQELNLVPQLDIARNMFLGAEPILWPVLGIVDQSELYSRAVELLRRLHIALDPRTLVSELSVTQCKMVEIARALAGQGEPHGQPTANRGCPWHNTPRVIVMDEPTDVLEDQSRNELFGVIRRLKTEHQVGFVYISHRYQEVYELGDRVTILRDGRNIGTYDIKDVTLDELIAKMIGGQMKQQYPSLPEPQADDKEPRAPSPGWRAGAPAAPALSVSHVRRGSILNDISLSVRKGEIVAVTGLMGAGKTELARAIAGVDAIGGGEISVCGQRVPSGDPAAAIACGIGFLTEDRKGEGLVLEHSLRDNYALPSVRRFSPWGLMRGGEIDAEIAAHVQRLQIKAPGIHWPAGQLSGGNQQKVVIAKWLGARCKVLLFDEPTRGIDIKGRAEVYHVMAELLKSGVGILMCTSDYVEALAMSHRIVVLVRGEVRRIFKRGEATEEDLLRTAIGAEQGTMMNAE